MEIESTGDPKSLFFLKDRVALRNAARPPGDCPPEGPIGDVGKSTKKIRLHTRHLAIP